MAVLDPLRRWARRAARLVGGCCALCGVWCQEGECPDCRVAFADPPGPRCVLCALRLPAGATGPCGRCLLDPPPWVRCVAALDYRFPWDRQLLALKFGERLDLAALLARRLDEALVGVPAPELLLPMPLSPGRMRERGYNQSLEIARRLARRREWRLSARSLMRVRETAPQARLPLDRRRGNLRAAFAVVEPVHGRRVALLDDVMTSGATLREAAATLHRAGAAEVQAWVVARTPE